MVDVIEIELEPYFFLGYICRFTWTEFKVEYLYA